MGLFNKLLGRKQPANSQEAVLIHFNLGSTSNGDHLGFDDMVDLEDKLIAVIERHHVGELDGNEIGETDGIIFTYGPDANRLFTVVEPVLRGHPLGRGARVVVRKGGPGSPQTEVRL
jgi:hypothetical protein